MRRVVPWRSCVQFAILARVLNRRLVFVERRGHPAMIAIDVLETTIEH